MSAQPDLLPCPFCGSLSNATNGPTFFASGRNAACWCVVCPCCAIGTGHYGSKEQAAERWNTRAAPSAAESADGHTPGEWVYDGPGFDTVSVRGGPVVVKAYVMEAKTWADGVAQRDANLALIAQAPAMRAALERIERLSDFSKDDAALASRMALVNEIARRALTAHPSQPKES